MHMHALLSVCLTQGFVNQLDARGGVRGVVAERGDEIDFESDHLLARCVLREREREREREGEKERVCVCVCV